MQDLLLRGSLCHRCHADAAMQSDEAVEDTTAVRKMILEILDLDVVQRAVVENEMARWATAEQMARKKLVMGPKAREHPRIRWGASMSPILTKDISTADPTAEILPEVNGLKLHVSTRGAKRKYIGVRLHRNLVLKKYQARYGTRSLGYYCSAPEAAFAYAKHKLQHQMLTSEGGRTQLSCELDV